ncbi:MAG: MBL fold metallo-hydrolase [Chloroflexales bacterium]|nr:MBL fold metallo-hydrolase [Chloroflexales bacterium]
MDPQVTVTELEPNILAADRSLSGTGEGEIGLRALLLLGEHLSLILDTLIRPEDMAQFATLVRDHGRPLLVVNTHADYDHAWGNGAFASPIIGQTGCRQRLLGEQEVDMLDQMRAKAPDFFDAVMLVPPQITFEHRLDIALGGMTVELHHLPGHTPDSLLAYVPERGLLFAGDCAEWPIPVIGNDPLPPWISALRQWAKTPGLRTVIPAHGRIGGAELLEANAAYLEQLDRDADAPWQRPAGADPWYLHEAHPLNVTTRKKRGL